MPNCAEVKSFRARRHFIPSCFSDLMYPCKVRCYTNGCHLNATRIDFPIPRGEARDHENFVFTIP